MKLKNYKGFTELPLHCDMLGYKYTTIPNNRGISGHSSLSFVIDSTCYW